jgi:hypothetical protein
LFFAISRVSFSPDQRLIRHRAGLPDTAKAVHERGLRSVSGSSGVDGQTQPGVLTAAHWMAAMDEPSSMSPPSNGSFPGKAGNHLEKLD